MFAKAPAVFGAARCGFGVYPRGRGRVLKTRGTRTPPRPLSGRPGHLRLAFRARFADPRRVYLRILVYLVMYDSGEEFLEHPLLSWYP